MIAIYARQSVDKKDSISIETQIEDCKRKIDAAEHNKIEIFKDKGYSGKNTDRPEFQRMMAEIRKGTVSMVVIYKLDRISRSLIDFLKMRQVFEKHDVKFISYSEDFDTSTANRKLMLGILMMFAENERENIQKRITDNYYARGEKGLYLGGYAPFGYTKTETQVNGKKTYMFVENTDESGILKEIYSRYLDGESLSAITRWLNSKEIPTRKGKPWNASGVARTLRNPAYVKANADVYNYLRGLGATMNNPVDDYIGINGCSVYGKTTERKHSKFVDLSTDFVTLALHEGIIEPSTWMGVQLIFSQKANHSNLGTGSLTWLQGLLRCSCGYSYYVKRCKTKVKEHRYIYCRGWRSGVCSTEHKMIPVGEIEEIAEAELLSYIKRLRDIKEEEITKAESPEINQKKIQLVKLDEKIRKLMDFLLDDESTEISHKYFNQALEKLDKEKQQIISEIGNLQLKANKPSTADINIDEILSAWHSFEIEKKKSIAKKTIEKIVINSDTIDILFY